MRTNIFCFFLALLALGFAGCDRDRALPPDADTLVGQLENGLTYYVRENAKPANRLELRLVVLAGSVQEEDDQQGLAHLLEHMAFNGTDSFDKQQLVDYLESIGMRFGPGLSAYTTFDQTVYVLQVPVDREGAVDTGFRILRDWAFGIRNEDAEIEQERRVVVEEWRLGRGARQRIRDAQFPVLFKGSRYADRLPIGKKHVLDSFEPKRVRDFYKTWYRPELMAVIAVGSVGRDEVLQRISTLFGGAAPPDDSTPRIIHDVPIHEDTLVSIVADREATASSVQILHKHAMDPLRTIADYRLGLIDDIISQMFRQRLDECRREPNTPFVRTHAYDGKWILGAAVFSVGAEVKDEGFEKGLRRLLEEEERVLRFGFTATEFDRAKSVLALRAEKQHAERETTESTRYASAYTTAFLFGRVEPGSDAKLQLTRRLLPTVTAGDISERSRTLLGRKSRVVFVSGPEKPGIDLPKEDAVCAILEAVDGWKIAAYEDSVADTPLLQREPVPGRIVKRETVPDLGVTIWTLSNGARVLLKPTQFKKDEILVKAISAGGHSLASDEDYVAAAGAAAVVNECGFGSFTRIGLQKRLAGKAANISPFIDELREGVTGSCRPADLRVLMQLLHLVFTSPRKDTEAFGIYCERRRAELKHRLAQPETAFWDCVKFTLAGEHPRRKPWTPETIDSLDLDSSIRFYRDRFGDAANFTFVFVGDFTTAQLEKHICRYVASLPAVGDKGTWRDLGIRAPEGRVLRAVDKGTAPKGRVYRVYGIPFTWEAQERQRVQAMLHILRIRLREKLRETIGGTYYTAVYPIYQHYPVATCESRISFGCAPDKMDALTAAVEKEVAHIQSELLDALYVTKAREIMLQEWKVGLTRNAFWMDLLESWEWHGEDPRVPIREFEGWVRKLSRESIREIAARYLKTDNVTTILLRPEPAGDAPGS